MKHIVRAAFVVAGLGILINFAYDFNNPLAFYENNARTVYFIGFILMVFSALSMKNVLSYKTVSKIDYAPKNEELKTSGLAISIILLFFIAPMFDQPERFAICECQWIRWIGCLFLIDAITFFTWSSWVFGKSFYRNDDKPSELKLISHGPYAVIRHPRFLGLISWSFATALAFNNIAALLLAVIITYIVGMKAQDEEVFMELEFGDQWLAYKKQTYRFIPLIY